MAEPRSNTDNSSKCQGSRSHPSVPVIQCGVEEAANVHMEMVRHDQDQMEPLLQVLPDEDSVRHRQGEGEVPLQLNNSRQTTGSEPPPPSADNASIIQTEYTEAFDYWQRQKGNHDSDIDVVIVIRQYQNNYTRLSFAEQNLLLPQMLQLVSDQIKSKLTMGAHNDDDMRTHKEEVHSLKLEKQQREAFLENRVQELQHELHILTMGAHNDDDMRTLKEEVHSLKLEKQQREAFLESRVQELQHELDILTMGACNDDFDDMRKLKEENHRLKEKIQKDTNAQRAAFFENLAQERGHELDMERKHRITMGTMAGVFQKTAERDALEDVITTYFTDTLQSFVNGFQLQKEEVCDMEDRIVRKLTAAFRQGREELAQRIVQFCVTQDAGPDAAKTYRAVAEQGHSPIDVVKRFLSASVYTEAPNQTLSELDWDLRKAAIFLKSAFFQAVEEKQLAIILEKEIKGKYAFLDDAVQIGRVSQSAVDNFLTSTVTLLQQMLMSESPIIPWTGLKVYDPNFLDLDVRQLSQQCCAMTEDDFRGWKIAGYKRPVLLSCNHGRVIIDKGKVRLEVPRK